MGNWSLELHRDISYRIPATVTQRRLEVVVKSVKRICSRSIFRSFMHELRVDIHHCFAIAPVHITPIHSIANSNRAHTNHDNITLHWFHSTNTFNRIWKIHRQNFLCTICIRNTAKLALCQPSIRGENIHSARFIDRHPKRSSGGLNRKRENTQTRNKSVFAVKRIEFSCRKCQGAPCKPNRLDIFSYVVPTPKKLRCHVQLATAETAKQQQHKHHAYAHATNSLINTRARATSDAHDKLQPTVYGNYLDRVLSFENLFSYISSSNSKQSISRCVMNDNGDE